MDVTKVKDILVEKGWSQTYLAKKSGISRQHLSNLLAGKHRRVSNPTIKKIADALGVEPKDIMEDILQTEIDSVKKELREFSPEKLEEVLQQLREMGFAEYVIEFVKLAQKDLIQIWQEELIKFYLRNQEHDGR
jgi:transcriptional regulator with XRE-family HTH domain